MTITQARARREDALLRDLRQIAAPPTYQLPDLPSDETTRSAKGRMNYCARMAAEAELLIERETM